MHPGKHLHEPQRHSGGDSGRLTILRCSSRNLDAVRFRAAVTDSNVCSVLLTLAFMSLRLVITDPAQRSRRVAAAVHVKQHADDQVQHPLPAVRVSLSGCWFCPPCLL